MSERVYIGLGSNLSEPLEQLQRAVAAIEAIPGSQLVGVSSFYISDPLGPADQPRYVNAVAALETDLPPLSLLDALQAIEQSQGRERKGERWGPRTLDLDILLFGLAILNEPRLTVPHYHLQARAFVLYPLAELVPQAFCLPDGRPLKQLLEACPFSGIERLASSGKRR